MTSDNTQLLVIAGAVFLLAGFIKGVIGLGLPAVSMGLLSLVMTPAHAAALLIVPSLVSNVWQLMAGPSFLPLLRRLWSMMVGIGLGVWAGAGLLASDTGGNAVRWLGVALAIYAALGLVKIRIVVPSRGEAWWSPFIGACTGLVSAATGVFAIPAVPYLEALGLEREDLIQALGLSFTMSTIALGADLARGGVFEASVATASLLALVPVIAGMLAGQWLRLRVKPAVFRLCFFLGLLALGIHLALRGVL